MNVFSPEESGEPAQAALATNFITYKIVSDVGDRLKEAARTACNFWNSFLEPAHPIVIRLELVPLTGSTIAQARAAYQSGGVWYGPVQFNSRRLAQASASEIVGTIIHEIGHTLGFGWNAWQALFNRQTGKFNNQAVARLQSLADMVVELEGGDGTALSHWDEETFGRELMTGYYDPSLYVLPVTIDVLGLLGHTVFQRLAKPTNLDELLDQVSNLVFSRQEEALSLDLDYFEKTEIFETVPHRPDPDAQ